MSGKGLENFFGGGGKLMERGEEEVCRCVEDAVDSRLMEVGLISGVNQLLFTVYCLIGPSRSRSHGFSVCCVCVCVCVFGIRPHCT